MKNLLAVLLVVLCVSFTATAQEKQKPMEKQQFIAVLKLNPRLLKEENWTEREHKIVERHFAKLQQLLKEGTVLLAGRTLPLDETRMGIVILEVSSEAEARRIMENDECVKEQVMTVQVLPFKVALSR